MIATNDPSIKETVISLGFTSTLLNTMTNSYLLDHFKGGHTVILVEQESGRVGGGATAQAAESRQRRRPAVSPPACDFF